MPHKLLDRLVEMPSFLRKIVGRGDVVVKDVYPVMFAVSLMAYASCKRSQKCAVMFSCGHAFPGFLCQLFAIQYI